MEQSPEQLLSQHFQLGIFFGIIGLILTTLAYRFHFYQLTKIPFKSPFKLKFPIIGALIYLALFLGAAPLVFYFLKPTLFSPILLITIAQMATCFAVITLLIIYSLFQEKTTLISIWKRGNSSLISDFFFGMLAYLISMPVVFFIAQMAQVAIYYVFGTFGEEQLAVRYLNLVKESPYLFAIALTIIVLIAPIIEEYIFRGFLYSYLKSKVGIKWGMILSSMVFALLHLSPAQGVTNISLFVTLLALGLYLAFTYEKRRSLITPIALHMTFNSISVMRILLVN